MTDRLSMAAALALVSGLVVGSAVGETTEDRRLGYDALVALGRIDEAYEQLLTMNARRLEFWRSNPLGPVGDLREAQPPLYSLLADHPDRLSPRVAFHHHLGFKRSAAVRKRSARLRLLQHSENPELEVILKDYAYRWGSWAKLFLRNLEATGGVLKRKQHASLAYTTHIGNPEKNEKLLECAFYATERGPCVVQPEVRTSGSIRSGALITVSSDHYVHPWVREIYDLDARRLRRHPSILTRKEEDPEYWSRFIGFRELSRDERLARSERLKAEFERIHGLYGEWRSQTPDVDSLASFLPAGSVYLDFGRFRRYDFENEVASPEWHYFVFAFRSGAEGHALEFADLGPTGEIDRVVDLLRSTIHRAKREDLPEVQAQAEALYGRLLAPFTGMLEGADLLIVSAEGRLHLLPFDVLRRPGGGYLADSHTVVYGQAGDWVDASFWADLPQRPDPSPGLVFASPDYDHRAAWEERGEGGGEPGPWPPVFEPLPSADDEGRVILERSDEAEAVLLTGAEAREIRLRSAVSPAFLHFATHGYFLSGFAPPAEDLADRGAWDRDFGGGSRLDRDVAHQYLTGLALAGANRLASGADVIRLHDDGILTTAEVESLQLAGTELVVMSACETGLGTVDLEADDWRGPRIGEGVASLRRAFRTAGAETVVMSFWDVADEEAPVLMEEFYRRYFDGETPVEALEAARETVRRQLVEEHGVDHPFYWAAFGIDTATLPARER